MALALSACAPYPATRPAAQQDLAASMRNSWLAFARSGRPAALSDSWWPRFTDATEELQSLAPQQSGVETGFATSHKCAFWSGLEH